MEVRILVHDSSSIAVIESDEVLIREVQDALDLMATIRHMYDCSKMILPAGSFCDDFYDLKTRLAGDILQKYTNYQVKLAIVGDFSKYPGKSLKDFIRESNRGNQIFFLPDEESAAKKLFSLN